MHMPRIMIAGTNSGCGKTTLTSGILAALTNRGMAVQPFKVGPDYIDPMFHSFITGRDSRNLDSWLLEKETLCSSLQRGAQGADLCVMEGVMGLYDGFGGKEEAGSSAHVSKLTGTPVVLVLNPEGMALSTAAMVKGFMDFDTGVDVRGVIFNRISGKEHYRLLKQIVEEYNGVPALGYLPDCTEYALEGRHLGLVPAEEVEGLREKIRRLAQQVEDTVELDRLAELAGNAPELPVPVAAEIRPLNHKCRIAVARDQAFNFYYRDNLDMMEQLGSELVYFSPLRDLALPEEIDGLYLGGGYPEVWAAELEQNAAMRGDICRSITAGLPAYAECGGFMYLCRSITDLQGKKFEMTGVIPGHSTMTTGLQRFGYVEMEFTRDTVLGKKGSRVRAHEFHFSITEVEENVPACYQVTKKRNNRIMAQWQCGYSLYNLLAAYPHIHFGSNPQLAGNFVESCLQFRKERVQRGG